MPKPRVVLDTNVVVSAHLTATGFERFALDLSLAAKLQLIISPSILAEYQGVLIRPRFHLSAAQVRKSIALIKERSLLINPRLEIKASKDPTDNMFLECAEAGKADYLVTGNKRHFPEAWKATIVVNAKELITLIAPDLQA